MMIRTDSIPLEDTQVNIPNLFRSTNQAAVIPGSTQNLLSNSVTPIALAIFRRHSKIPQGMAASIRRAPQKEPKSKNMLSSSMADAMRGKIKGWMNIVNCEICQTQMKKSDKFLYMCDCEHKFSFCESCLHHYVIYKVKNFQEVTCPNDACDRLIDTTTPFFKQLPKDIQQKYRKIHQFFQVAKDPNSKLCPKQKCQGVIKKLPQDQTAMRCNSCKQDFCSKCLLARHAGLCDNQQLQFFKNNLHYRQCKRCQFIIEKNQGCNHMTCRCGYQFCYVCGADWKPVHYGDHDQSGNIIPEGARRNNQPAVDYVPQPVDNNQCCDCDTDNLLCKILSFPFRLLLCLLLLLLFLFVFLAKDAWSLAALFLGSIIAGMTAFTVELISQAEGACCILMVIFLPITMIIGMGVGIQKVFCQTAWDMVKSSCDILTGGCESIWSD